MKRLDAWNDRRQQLVAVYLNELEKTELVLPYVPYWASPVWHLFVVRTNLSERLQKGLTTKGIETMIHYPISPHMQPAYSQMNIMSCALPISETMNREVISLPIGPHLDVKDIHKVVDAVKSIIASTAADMNISTHN